MLARLRQARAAAEQSCTASVLPPSPPLALTRARVALAVTRHSVTGWVENTASKTIRGEACGDARSVAAFKRWLSKTGSPKSRIDKAVFGNERRVAKSPFLNGFELRRTLLANGRQWA